MNAWFISDLHLKNAKERNAEILLRFLHFLQQPEQKTTHLFLLGDIFDLWVGDHEFYYLKFKDIVDAVLQLKKQSVEVYYFEGNHDIHVRKFWQKHGVDCYFKEQFFQLGPWTVRAEHGDHINPKEVFYQRCLEIIRMPIVSVVAQLVPAKMMNDFGERMSQKSRKKSTYQRTVNETELKKMIREYAVLVFKNKKFDYLVTGHVHVQDDFKFENSGNDFQSINLGSWFQQPKALHLTEQGHSWKNLN